jgi:hypothetical protein
MIRGRDEEVGLPEQGRDIRPSSEEAHGRVAEPQARGLALESAAFRPVSDDHEVQILRGSPGEGQRGQEAVEPLLPHETAHGDRQGTGGLESEAHRRLDRIEFAEVDHVRHDGDVLLGAARRGSWR